MPGGLIQLTASGAQNVLLNGNPSVSFFKKVYKTHTNFAMESMNITCNKNYIHCKDKTELIAKLKRNGDLIQDIYFCFEIPEIKKVIKTNENGNIIGDDFRFVKNLGESIIDEYFIYIGGSVVDKQYGEWLHIWNELSIQTSKRYGYDKLIGNVPDLYLPDSFNRLLMNEVQISNQKIYVPLKFWFNRNPGLALPLLALQYHEVEIHIVLRPLFEVYTINGVSPTDWVEHGNPYFGTSEKVNISPYLDINYIFLDTFERNYFAKNTHEYLIEQIQRFTFPNIARNSISDLPLQNPVKEIIWNLKRNDISKSNRWYDMTDFEFKDIKFVENNAGKLELIETIKDREILKNAKILLNGMDRFEEKDATYFNLIQPYQHHTVIPKAGIYVYSFSLYPESFQPSGACNMSRIKKVQLKTEVCQLPIDTDYNYDLTVYVISYNFLRITSGLGGLAFSW